MSEKVVDFMHRWACFIVLPLCVLFIAACGGVRDDAAVDTNSTLARQQVSIEQPHIGTVIYSETITLSGQAQDTFLLLLIDAEDTVIAERSITPDDGIWRLELVHGYTGEPTEVTIQAVQADEIVASASILLSDINQRPEGIYGLIIIPANGVEVGGDAFLSEGRASGMESMMIELAGDNGQVLHSAEIQLDNPERINEVPWQTEIPVGDYTGQATLRIYTVNESGVENTLDSTRFTVLMAAG